MDVVASARTTGPVRCPKCHATFGVAVRFVPDDPTLATVSATRAAPRVLPPLQARPPRRAKSGQGALAALAVLLLVAGGTLIAIAHPWDAGSILPGVGGGDGLRGDGGRLPGGRGEPPADAVDGIYHRTYSWSYGGTDWTFKLNIPKTDYDSFHDVDPRPSRIVERNGALYRQMAYDVFVTTPLDDAYMQELADQLHTAAQGKGWSDDQTLSFALSFVQSLPYTSDRVTTGFDEWPRYPLETLVDNGGDCEDTSILYASLVQALGYGAILVSPPNHMAVGVKAQSGVSGISYQYQGSSYLYAETTGEGWALGEAPPEYGDATVQIFDLVPKPLFSLKVSYNPNVVGGMQELTLNATAIGSALADGVELTAQVTSGRTTYDTQTCAAVIIAPGHYATCLLRLDLRKVPRGQEVLIESKVLDSGDSGTLYARQDSAPWVPCNHSRC